MQKYFEDLQAAAFHVAIRQTVERVTLTALISALVSIVVMQIAIGRVHPIGLVMAITLPLALSTPTTLFMCLKHQQLRAANKKLQELASTDFLTGTLNRRAFTDKVEAFLSTFDARGIDDKGALMIVDVDSFKHVNDTFGHEAGDLTLQMMISQLKNSLPHDALIGRLGGEEFAIFLSHTNAADAAELATNICRMVNQTDFSPAGLDISVSISIGVTMTSPGIDWRRLFRRADRKLYEAKKGGRNRVALSLDSDAKVQHAA